MHNPWALLTKFLIQCQGRNKNLHYKKFPAAAAELGWHWRIRELEEKLEMCRVFAAVSPSGWGPLRASWSLSERISLCKPTFWNCVAIGYGRIEVPFWCLHLAFDFSCFSPKGFPGSSAVKNPLAMQETCVWFLVWEHPLGKGMTTTVIFLPRESHGQRSLLASVLGVSRSGTQLKKLNKNFST